MLLIRLFVAVVGVVLLVITLALVLVFCSFLIVFTFYLKQCSQTVDIKLSNTDLTSNRQIYYKE